MTRSAANASKYDVVVIGAGHNGLTAAALLARAGRKVLVVERRAGIGGLAASETFHPGYRTGGLLHDTRGIRPEVVETLQLERHGLVLADGPPPVYAAQANGPGLLLDHDPRSSREEIAAHSSRDADRYAEYRTFIDLVRPVLLRWLDAAPPSIDARSPAAVLPLLQRGWALRRLGRSRMSEVLRVAPMCVADWLDEWFESDLLKSVLAARAIFGSFAAPRSPGTGANLLRDEVLAGRAARGGPHAFAAALAAAARAQGVEIRTETPVRRILAAGGIVAGVELEDGAAIETGLVAASCDPTTTVLQLLSARDVPARVQQRMEHFRSRATTAVVRLALDRPLRFAARPDLAIEHAHVGERLVELERAFDAAKYGTMSDVPLLDVHVPTVATPELAPPGHAVVSILVSFAPHDVNGGWDDAKRETLGARVVEQLGGYAPDLEKSVVAHEVLAPPDIAARYGLTNGHLFHGEHGLDQLLVRPSPECVRYRTPVRGLYLCGSGSHPGGGITGAPGRLAAMTILKDG